MRIAARFVLAACMATAVSWPLVAQQTQPAQTAPAKVAAAPTGVAATVNFDEIRVHYYRTHPMINPSGIVAMQPAASFEEPHCREGLS